MNCSKCHSSQFVKKGHTHYGKQRFRCQKCGRQFVPNPSRQPISQETRDLIDKLLKERLSLAAMASPAPEAHRAGVGLDLLRFSFLPLFCQSSLMPV
jgi:hypothetical protein